MVLTSCLSFRAVRQPPCPSSRAAASLGAIAEPWAPPEVPHLLACPRGFRAPWGFPQLFEKPVSAGPCAEAAASARSRVQTRCRISTRRLPGTSPTDVSGIDRRFLKAASPACALPRARRHRLPAATHASSATTANATSLHCLPSAFHALLPAVMSTIHRVFPRRNGRLTLALAFRTPIRLLPAAPFPAASKACRLA